MEKDLSATEELGFCETKGERGRERGKGGKQGKSKGRQKGRAKREGGKKGGKEGRRKGQRKRVRKEKGRETEEGRKIECHSTMKGLLEKTVTYIRTYIRTSLSKRGEMR